LGIDGLAIVESSNPSIVNPSIVNPSIVNPSIVNPHSPIVDRQSAIGPLQ
jgi:hypothetical protein